jgi:hypothetical protein
MTEGFALAGAWLQLGALFLTLLYFVTRKRQR